MDYQAIKTVLRNGVGVVTLNRPEMMNALNTQMRAEITHAFKTLEKDARVIVMTGAGTAFCSGQDLGDGGSAGQAPTLRLPPMWSSRQRMPISCRPSPGSG